MQEKKYRPVRISMYFIAASVSAGLVEQRDFSFIKPGNQHRDLIYSFESLYNYNSCFNSKRYLYFSCEFYQQLFHGYRWSLHYQFKCRKLPVEMSSVLTQQDMRVLSQGTTSPATLSNTALHTVFTLSVGALDWVPMKLKVETCYFSLYI